MSFETTRALGCFVDAVVGLVLRAHEHISSYVSDKLGQY